jgi:hypothetical protein
MIRPVVERLAQGCNRVRTPQQPIKVRNESSRSNGQGGIPLLRSIQTKSVEELAVSDFVSSPVWQYVNDESSFGETALQPIKQIPVAHLTGRLVGSKVRLANGSETWAVIGNVDATNPRSTKHFLVISVLHNGHCFSMARYHDFDWNVQGPDAVAGFLGLQIDEVFPITYDLRRVCHGDPDALCGVIEKNPNERLTPEELMSLAVP